MIVVRENQSSTPSASTPAPAASEPALPSLREIREAQVREAYKLAHQESERVDKEIRERVNPRRDALENERRQLAETPGRAEAARASLNAERDRRQASLTKAETLLAGVRETLKQREKVQGIKAGEIASTKARAAKLRENAERMIREADELIARLRPVEESAEQARIAEVAEANARANCELHDKNAPGTLAEAIAADESKAGRLAAITQELAELGTRDDWKNKLNESRRRRDALRELAHAAEYRVVDLPDWANE